MPDTPIPFHQPKFSGREIEYISEILQSRHPLRTSGDGKFTALCHAWLEKTLRSPKALLTHSATGALELAALLCNLAPGDEVIMPSFTFVSTANAVVLRGAVPVFVDIRSDTLNIDEGRIEDAITPRTKAVFVVHYAGISCAMDEIAEICRRHNLFLVEDAAQGILATYNGRALGTLGDFGCLSFHETKNVVSGEGGALLISDAEQSKRAEIIREKGTNRSQFFRGEVDKYTWVDIGSSFLPSDVIAAILYAQLEVARELCSERVRLWNEYHSAFEKLSQQHGVGRPTVPADCEHNGHLYYLMARTPSERAELLKHLKSSGVSASFHYVPLHTSPAGMRFGRTHGSLKNTEDLSERMVRLPLWSGDLPIHNVIETVQTFYRKNS